MSDGNKLDNTFASYLRKTTTSISRRSFISKMSVGVLGIFGISLVSKVSLFTVPLQAQDVPPTPSNWQHCGLHGYLCQGNCNAGSVGTGVSAKWVQCCKDPSCDLYFCCGYADQCGIQPTNWGVDCGGVRPSGPSWCGTNTSETYVCTLVDCNTSKGYGSASSCSCDQHPACN